jgi:hypothetical protein
MKRYAVILLAILVSIGIVTSVLASIRRATEMPVRFNTRDFPEHGVQIVTPVHSSFNDMVQKYFKNSPPDTLQPFSVFIQNTGKKLMLGYALTWELRDSEGQIILRNTVGYTEPGLLLGDEIPKGMKHTTAIEPKSFNWNSKIEPEAVSQTRISDSDAVRNILAYQLSRAADISVSLDGVFFDDATFVGPNETGFFDQMQAMLRAKSDLLEEVATASQRGTLDQAFDKISAYSNEPDVVFGPTFSSEEWYRYFRKAFATEMHNKRRAYGKDILLPDLLKSHDRAIKKLKKS